MQLTQLTHVFVLRQFQSPINAFHEIIAHGSDDNPLRGHMFAYDMPRAFG